MNNREFGSDHVLHCDCYRVYIGRCCYCSKKECPLDKEDSTK